MGPTWLLEFGLLIVVAQARASPSGPQKCTPGFEMDGIVFDVEKIHLQKGRVLGKVGFDDCMGRNEFAFGSSDSHFKVVPDGTLKVNKEITLHGGQMDFVIYSLNPTGPTFTTTIRVLLHGNGYHNHGNHPNKSQEHQNRGDYHHNLHKSANVDSSNKTEVIPIPDLPVINFPASLGLRRQKRAWVIPVINFLENDRGPFPKPVVQIRSDADKEVKILYKITGPGANEPPMGLFTVDKNTGQLYATQPLDREKQDKYILKAHADTLGEDKAHQAEAAMDIIINILDENDNRPIFIKEPFVGEVAEASVKDTEVTTIAATDLDDPNTLNAIVHYKILSQEPKLPSPNMFAINPVSGVIRVNHAGLDREKISVYTLEVEATDREGTGGSTKGLVILTVTDINDNAPAFEESQHEAMVPENKVGVLVKKFSVTDDDEPLSPAWNAKFKIVGGDFEGQFSVETALNKQEGIIKTIKPLDYETFSKYTLLVIVENEIPFATTSVPTATATVVITVEDVNEAPVFSPPIKVVAKSEDLKVGSEIVQYTATDPDTARTQKVSYKIVKDPARWLSVSKDTGLIKVESGMDREGQYVKGNIYTALIAAYDDDEVPATGTGTLEITLQDVNDNYPSIKERSIRVCNKESAPQLLSVTDADGPDFSEPYTVSLQGMSKNNWTAKMNDTKTGIILTLVMPLPTGDYSVVLKVADNHGLSQDNIVQATVCDCSGVDVACKVGRIAGIGLPVILGILGAILLLLMLVLLLLMFIRRRGGEKKEPLLQEDDIRDNIYYYDEEGGGEDDQDYYDLSVIHRGLDNRPDIFRNDVVPNFMPAAQYRPRPANPEDIGNFIVDNLKAADNDPLAPPYDSLLVFDDEGKGSDAGTLSSLNSSSSGDQDYDCLGEWGPRFKKLADMYGGGEDDML